MNKKPIDHLERVIRPIIEGQIRGFAKEHPEIVEAVNWYKPRKDKQTTFVNSLAKRIIRDLLCPISRARIEAAILAAPTGTPNETDCGLGNCNHTG